MNKFIQLLACKDQALIVKQVCEFIANHSGNILEMEQHVDQTDQMFFLRIVWETQNQYTGAELSERFSESISIEVIHSQFIMVGIKQRVAVLVSKMDHCLFEILMRYQNKEWDIEIPLVISNHPDLKTLCDRWQIPFLHLPILSDKTEQETQILTKLSELKIDTVVLARYMQILTTNFVNEYPNAIINIHHSFLPAFIGSKPYHKAHAQGVKMVGATSHYVTEDLDKGPIISQDTTAVNHTHSIADFIHMGKDVEKKVLIDALSAHFEHRIIVIGNKTIVFR